MDKINLGQYMRDLLPQNLDGQTDALNAAGCEKIFADTASGKLAERPELTLGLGYLRAGDTLVVWRLDRLGQSLRHLVETVNALADRGRTPPMTYPNPP